MSRILIFAAEHDAMNRHKLTNINKSIMDRLGIKSAWLLAAGAIFALSVTILNSCSSDDDYDMYMGDELRTHAAATRSASGESYGGADDGGSGKTIVYSYSFNGQGSVVETETISAADDFVVNVEFAWNGNGGDAKSEDISTSCTHTNPSRSFVTESGEAVNRVIYANIDCQCTKVIPEIGNAEGKSFLTTDLTVNYTEILYNIYGTEIGRAPRTISRGVKVEVTDKIKRTALDL